ncbi:MAG: hypothetical protein HGB19_11115 [Chlorobiales bacterium]|nr:hypothetical protein [Chlorobiales bacterium]
MISVFLLAPRQGKQTVGKPLIYGNAKEKQRYPKCYDQFLNQFFIPGFLFLFTTRVNLVKAILIVVWVLFARPRRNRSQMVNQVGSAKGWK